MEIFPAIDLLNNNAVRLYQGDYNQIEIFGEPSEFAQTFAQQGALNLHLVDLDGAKIGKPTNQEIIRKITSNNPTLFCELGGGIRDEKTVETYFEAGIGRVILGTAALQDKDFTKKMLQKYTNKIAIGVDAKNGKVATEGWLNVSNVDSYSFCKEMTQLGAEYIIYTDIARDGTGTGANIAAYEKLAKISGLNITASGGVSSLDNIEKLKEIGLYAAILGKALYNKSIALPDALSAAKEINQ